MERTGSLFLSLNFEGGIPARIEIVPAASVVTGRDGRRWKNSKPHQAALNSNARLPSLPIDENHSTDLAAPRGGASPAFGWMSNLCADENGAIWADVEWTERGRDALSKKEYQYISPVFCSDEQGEINCILRAALTNTPNLQLPALNSAQSPHGQPDQINTEDCMTKELCAALGLAETATVHDALAAIDKLKTARNAEGSVDLTAYAPRAELNAAVEKALGAEKQLTELAAAAFKKEAEAFVDGAIKAGKFAPASGEMCLSLCADKTAFENFKSLAEKTPAVIDGKVQVPEAAPPSGSVSLNSEETAMAKAMGYSVEEYRKMKEAGT
jgi:phage I-like protein